MVSKEQVQIQQIRLQLHPYLRLRGQSQQPLPEQEQGFIRWDMRASIRNASFSTESANRSWTRGRNAPATFPPTSEILIISEAFPWVFQVHDPAGVTVGRVMDTIDAELHRRAGANEMPADRELAKAIASSYHRNRDELRGILMDGMLRIDFLATQTEFGGLDQDEETLAERMNVRDFPIAFCLVCEGRAPLR